MATTPAHRSRSTSAPSCRRWSTPTARRSRVLIPAALIVFTPVALIAAISCDSARRRAARAASSRSIASAWYTGMVVRTVQDVQDGRVDASHRRSSSPRSRTCIVPLILVGIVVGICVVRRADPADRPGPDHAHDLVRRLAGRRASRTPACSSALGRSRELVRGNGWQVFGVIVSVFAIILVVSIVIGSIGAIGDSFVLIFIVQLLLNVALAPIFALAAAVLYFALRRAHGQPVRIDPATGAFAPPQAPRRAPRGPTHSAIRSRRHPARRRRVLRNVVGTRAFTRNFHIGTPFHVCQGRSSGTTRSTSPRKDLRQCHA